MRLALFTLTAGLLACAAGFGQDTKKKDDKKEAPKVVTEVGGRDFQHWLDEIRGTDPSKRAIAMKAVMMFGPEKAEQAVPVIISELKKHKPDGKHIDLSVRVDGTIALGTILGAMKPSKSEGIKEEQTKMIDDAVAILRDFCKDSQVLVRTRAVQALSQLGPQAKKARDEVMKVAGDLETWEARQAGLETLTILTLWDCKEKKDKEKDPTPETKVLNVYFKALGDNSMQVRVMSIKALAQFPYPASPKDPVHANVVTKLRLVKDKDAETPVRMWANLALMTIKVFSKQAIDKKDLLPLESVLNNPKIDRDLRIQAAQAIGIVGKDAGPVAASLRAGINDEDLGIVAACMSSLARVDEENAEVAIAPKLKHKDKGMRIQAAGTLGQLGKHARPALGNLKEAFTEKDQDPAVVAACISAFAHIGKGKATADLAAMLEHPEPSIRAHAADALGEIGPDAKSASGALIKRLHDPEPSVVYACMGALARMKAMDAVPELQKISTDMSLSRAMAQAAKDAIAEIMRKETTPTDSK
jgi:HEAT repeat protein